MTTTWQQPFVNFFKTFKIAQNGLKVTRKGSVNSHSDKIVKSLVYTITGQVPANSYIQLPADAAKDSLNLVGRYFYLLYKPLPNSYFTFHLDITTNDTKQTVRISLSNLFKEYKTSSSWLQFPVVVDAPADSVDGHIDDQRLPDGKRSPSKTAWTMLCLDLRSILAMHLNRQYGSLKAIRICANCSVRNAFTSSVEFCPIITPQQARQLGILTAAEQYSPMPREMNFPTSKTEPWDTQFHYLRYPNTRITGPFNVIRRGNLTASDYFAKENLSLQVPIENGKAVEKSAQHKGSEIFQKTSPKRRSKNKEDLPELKVAEIPQHHIDDVNKVESTGVLATETHIFFDNGAPNEPDGTDTLNLLNGIQNDHHNRSRENIRKFDVTMTMKSVFGFSAYQKKGNRNQVAIHPNGIDYFYACGNSIVRMRNEEQVDILTGHSGPVVALTLVPTGNLLISAQANRGESYSIIRVWTIDFVQDITSCISTSRIPHTDLSFLVASKTGDFIAGVGRLKSGIQYLLVWDISAVEQNGDIRIFGKATIHAESQGSVEGITFLNNDEKLLTYGQYKLKSGVAAPQGSCLKLWELRSGSLSWTAVNVTATPDLYEPSGNDGFEEKYTTLGLCASGAVEYDGLVYCCFRGGYMLVLDARGLPNVSEKQVYQKNQIFIRERHLLDPIGHVHNAKTRNKALHVPLSCIMACSTYFAIGSSDGIVRLITKCDPDKGSIFGEIFLEAEHDAGIDDLRIEPNNKWIMVATSTSLGKLDVPKRSYKSLARGHTNKIVHLSVDSLRRRVVTVGLDFTIRVWCLDSRVQLFDFTCQDDGDQPTCTDIHFNEPLLLVGFASGMVRCFRLSDSATGLEFEVPVSQTRQNVLRILFTPTTDDLHLSYRYLVLGERELSLWSRDEVVRTIPSAAYYANEGTRVFLEVSADSRFIAIRAKKSVIALYRPATLDLCFKIDIKSTESCPISVAFGPGPVNLLYVLTDTNKLLSFWIGLRMNPLEELGLKKRPQIGQMMSEIDLKVPDVVSNMQISETGKVLFTACRDTIRVWDLESDPKRMRYKEFYAAGKISNLRLLMDHKTLVSTSAGCINVHEYGVLTQDIPPIPKSTAQADSDDEEIEPITLQFDEEFSLRPSLKPIPHHSAVTSPGQDVDLNLSLDGYDPLQNKRSSTKLIEQLNKADQPLVYSRAKARTQSDLLSERIVLEKTHISKEPAIELTSTFGFNGLYGRRNICWAPVAGFLIYDNSSFIVKEDIQNSEQTIYRLEHSQEQGNSRPISSISLKNDGKFLCVALEAQGVYKPQLEIIALELDRGAPIKILDHQHRGNIVSSTFSRDDRFLFTASDDRVVAWSTYDWTPVQQAVQATASETQLCISVVADHCTSERFAIAWQNKIEVYFLDADERKLKRMVLSNPARMRSSASGNLFTAVAFNTWQDQSERLLFGSLASGLVVAWSINNGKQVAYFTAAETEITCLVTTHEMNNRLVLGTVEGNVRVWDTTCLIDGTIQKAGGSASEKVCVLYDHVFPSAIQTLIVDKRLKLGIAGVEEGTIYYVDLHNPDDNTRLISGGAGDQVTSMDAIARPVDDYSMLVTGHQSGCVRLWNADHRELLTNFEIVDGNRLGESCMVVKCLSAVDDRELEEQHLASFIAAGYSKGSVRVFDINTNELAIRVAPFNSAVTALELGPEAKLWAGAKNGCVALISLTNGLTARIITEHRGCPMDFINGVYDKNTNQATMICGARDSRFSVWKSDVEDGVHLVDWISVATPPHYIDGTAFECREIEPVDQRSSRTSTATHRTGSAVSARASSRGVGSMGSMSSFRSGLSSKTGKDDDAGRQVIIDWTRLPKALMKITGGYGDGPLIAIFACYGLKAEVTMYSLTQKQKLRTVTIGHWANTLTICGNNYVVVGAPGGLLEVIDVTSGHIHDISAHTSKITAMTSINSQTLLTASSNGELLFWSTTDRRRNQEKSVAFL